jgi:opacity protein-like surface antigen
MMQFRFGAFGVAAAAACLAFGGASVAQAQEGDWYIGLTMPLMFIDDSETISSGETRSQQGTTMHRATAVSEHDTGFKFGAMLGYRLESGLRLEGEVFMARADVTKITNTSITVTGVPHPPIEDLPLAVSGAAQQLGVMANVWYDLETIDDAWTPYIGGGLGLVRIDQGDLNYDTDALAERIATLQLQQRTQNPQDRVEFPDGFVPTPADTDTAFAFQIGAGVGYALSETATLQLGYRLQIVNGPEFNGMNQTGTVNTETDLRIHFLEIGIRQAF